MCPSAAARRPDRVERAVDHVAIRVEGGLNVKLNQRLGLRAAVYFGDGDLEAWLQQLAVVPESESLGERVGGYGLLYIRW